MPSISASQFPQVTAEISPPSAVPSGFPSPLHQPLRAPMHGKRAGFIRVLQRDLPERFIMSYTGTRYVFGA